MTTQPINTAPPGDGWILGQIDASDTLDFRGLPWAILTRCDGGWRDEDGYPFDPFAWVSLPEPQPKPTGWRKAEGTVDIAPFVYMGLYCWLVFIRMLDGEYDASRGTVHVTALADAKDHAAEWARSLGLDVAIEALEMCDAPRRVMDNDNCIRKER